jgi:hypothetical protein
VRRTVATLLVVASPILMVAPVGAQERRVPAPTVTPAAPAPVQAVVPTAPVTVAPPAAPVVAVPAAPAPVKAVTKATAAVRPAAKVVPANPAAVSDAAYDARLMADLCQARAIFCGLDRGGRYPAG